VPFDSVLEQNRKGVDGLPPVLVIADCEISLRRPYVLMTEDLLDERDRNARGVPELTENAGKLRFGTERRKTKRRSRRPSISL